MKKVEVTSCSHSHGAPIVRVTMSQTTEVQKQIRVAPQPIINKASSQSSAGHLSWRGRCRTSERSSAMYADFYAASATLERYFTALMSCWILAACGPSAL